MGRHTLIAGVVNAAKSFTVDTDCAAWMFHSTLKAAAAFSAGEAFAAGTHAVIGILAADADVSLAAKRSMIVTTVFYTTS